ncbi:STAS domain-containing protein [Actinocrispum sp. NPDC049592]|uniref:STAS domain-containing protein n=1 Tax=Actinocrispum sp. NPDC049592 TaxID=3154835 RepID=UPI0034217408
MTINTFATPSIISVRTSHQAQIAVVHVAGEVDMSSVEPLESAVRHELTARPPGLVMDLLNVVFWGSSGLRVLIQARDQAESASTRLRVVATAPAVLRPLELSGLAELFDVRGSVSAAVRDLVA